MSEKVGLPSGNSSSTVSKSVGETPIASEKTIQESQPGATPPVTNIGEEEEKKKKKTPLSLFYTLQRQIEELESAFENIATQDLAKKICKEARTSLSEAYIFLNIDGTGHTEANREGARKIYLEVWKRLQFLGRFLHDVQPLGTTTEQFYKLTIETQYPTVEGFDDRTLEGHFVKHLGKDQPILEYVNPNLTKGSSNHQNSVMEPSEFLVDYLREYEDHMKNFLKRGIQLLESEQEYLRDKYSNIATIATFFSSITASTLQFSFDQGTNTLWTVVNTLWFLSLISSIASAANALFAITWHKSLCRSVRKLQVYTARGKDKPKQEENKRKAKMLDRWFDSCPMALLVSSGALFMAGLVVFSYASLQHIITIIMVLVLVSCHALCVARVFVELLAFRWGGVKGYVDKPIGDSFSTFLLVLLFALRLTSAPLFFVFDLFSLQGWKFMDTIGKAVYGFPAFFGPKSKQHRKSVLKDEV